MQDGHMCVFVFFAQSLCSSTKDAENPPTTSSADSTHWQNWRNIFQSSVPCSSIETSFLEDNCCMYWLKCSFPPVCRTFHWRYAWLVGVKQVTLRLARHKACAIFIIVWPHLHSWVHHSLTCCTDCIFFFFFSVVFTFEACCHDGSAFST